MGSIHLLLLVIHHHQMEDVLQEIIMYGCEFQKDQQLQVNGNVFIVAPTLLHTREKDPVLAQNVQRQVLSMFGNYYRE